MQSDTLKARWAHGATALGAWISTREPLIAEVAGSAGYDYVCVDLQHGLSDLRDMTASVQAMAGGEATPIVRVPWNEPGVIGRALDLGAMGVIVPMVNTPEEAAAAVAACRYAPAGRRSIGPVAPVNRYGPTYYSTANEKVACIPMIETRQAVERIDEILAVPGIDAVYIGPADLSITLGLPPAAEQADEGFQQALLTVVESCRRHGVVPGIHASAALAGKRAAQGFRMITVGLDLVSALAGLRSDLKAAKEAVGAGHDPSG